MGFVIKRAENIVAKSKNTKISSLLDYSLKKAIFLMFAQTRDSLVRS